MSDTTQDLITRVKNRETIPDSGAAYSDEVLLEYLDQSLKGYIVPAVESVIEEHFVVTVDKQMPAQPSYSYTSPPTNVGNTLTIPGESTGLRLRDVYVVGTDGSFYNIQRLTPTQAASQSWGTPWGPQYIGGINQQMVGGFYLQGNEVQIFPYGLASNKLIRLTYQRAPLDLCLTSAAGQVTAVTGDVVTIDTVQSTWFSGITRVNAIQADEPHEFVKDARIATTVYTSYAPLNDMTLVNVSGNVLTLPAGTGANIQVGDWICPRGYSVFAQNIPKELLPALVQKAAEMCIHAAGDSQGQKIAEASFASMMMMAMKQIAPRVIGKPTKILNTNSPFKASRGSSWGRY